MADVTDSAANLASDRIYVFADEAGDFGFGRVAGATTYFVPTTLTMDSRRGNALPEPRRQLAWKAPPPDAGLRRH